MPWRETSVEAERIAFLREAEQARRGGFAGLCRKYGISRPTGYLWLKRAAEGEWVLASVVDRWRRPHRSRNRTVEEN